MSGSRFGIVTAHEFIPCRDVAYRAAESSSLGLHHASFCQCHRYVSVLVGNVRADLPGRLDARTAARVRRLDGGDGSGSRNLHGGVGSGEQPAWATSRLDDEPGITLLCKRLLTRAGFEVLAFTEPRKAVQELQKRRADLLLVDIRMPDIDGYHRLAANWRDSRAEPHTDGLNSFDDHSRQP